jgi:hypothetical protein
MLLSVDAWSSTGTLSSLPDAQWNATVPPVRLKLAIGKLSQPKCCHHNIHLFNKEQQFLSKQIQLIAAATQHGKNHRGLPGSYPPFATHFPGVGEGGGRKSFDPIKHCQNFSVLEHTFKR